MTDIYSGENGHIGFEVPGKIEVVIHPEYSFTITASDLPITRISDVENPAIVLAQQLERLRRGNGLGMRLTGFGKVDKMDQPKLARYHSDLESRMGLKAKKLGLIGVLIRIAPGRSIGVSPPDDVDILVYEEISARIIRKGFLTERLDEALKAVPKVLM